MMKTTAFIKKDAPEIFKRGRDTSRPEIQKWTNIFHHLSFHTEGFPIMGYEKNQGRDLIMINILSAGLREGGTLIEYISLEKELLMLV
jgi:hypothetical protein